MNAAVEENGQKRLLDEIELPLAEVLASMEREGFLVDAKGIEEFGKNSSGAHREVGCGYL